MKEITFWLVILVSNIIQGITGFAGTILAMPFSSMLIGIEESKFILNFLGIVASIWIIILHYKKINIEELKKILVFMGFGLIIGIFLSNILSINILLKLLPIIILVVAIRGLLTINNNKPIKNQLILICILIFSGMIHGMFVIGGPFLVIYANQTIKEKSEFRATLSVVWIVLNTIIFFSNFSLFLRTDYRNHALIAIIPLILGMIIGNKLHHKMNQKVFMILTFILLIISALSMFIK